ncbi:restriction endonuclease subunit S [Streptomonospora sediminis]
MWSSVRLKYIARLTAGGTPKSDVEEYWSDGDHGYPWVSISDMSTHDKVTDTNNRITKKGLVAARLRPSSPKTLLFSMYASLGHTAWLEPSGTWNQAILGITPNGTVDGRFLNYALISIRPNIHQFARSNTQSNLNAEQVGNLTLPMPSMDEQRRIADFLDAETARIDRLTHARARQIELLKNRLQSRNSQKFNHLSIYHPTARFKHALLGIEQGWSPDCYNTPAKQEEWGVLKSGAVNNGSFDPENNKRLPVDIAPKVRYRIRKGDLLMSRASGSLDLIGSIAVVPDIEKNLLLCDKIYRLYTDNTKVLPEYMAFIASSPQVRDQIKNGTSGAGGLANNLPSGVIRSLSLPLPPLECQREVVQRERDHQEAQQGLQKAIHDQLSLLTERRQALITAAVTGQLDVMTAGRAAVG